MVNQEPQPGASGTPTEKPSDHFSVRVENPDGIRAKAQDFFERSEQFTPIPLSSTSFLHPSFAQEKTHLEYSGLGALELHSSIEPTSARQKHADGGYYSNERVAHVAQLLQEQLSDTQVNLDPKPHGANFLNIEPPQLIVRVGLGFNSPETRRAVLDDTVCRPAIFIRAFIDSPNWYEAAEAHETPRIVSAEEL